MASLRAISQDHRIEVECLACGSRRRVFALTCDEVKECDRCGYVGWARPETLTEPDRRWLHEDLFARCWEWPNEPQALAHH